MRSNSILPARPLTVAPAMFDAPRAPVEPRWLVGATRAYARDQEVYGEGERADHVYSVLSGAVRSFRVLADGRRQISDFYLPGDVFGVEFDPDHRESVEALSETMLVVTRRCALADEDDGAMARRLWRLAVDQLRRSQDHVLTLGCRTANERVASFLTDLAERIGDAGGLELPMSRQDIADYLGLTIETVSRTLTQFQVAGMIALHGCRSIHFLKRRALADLCE